MPHTLRYPMFADGLGNPSSCSVPRCQLSHISKLAKSLEKSITVVEELGLSEGKATDKPLLIWLDTLCCPVSPPEAKSLALAQMRRTYEDAKHVLVLDASIECFPSDELHVTETLARIFTSGWMSRLWTLQETRLARSLWIQFKDRPVELDRLMVQLSQESSADVRYLPFNLDMVAHHRAVRPSFYSKYTNETSSVGKALWYIDSALHHRSTTVATDEPLCIATLLDLPIQELLGVPPTAPARTAEVWDLIAEKYTGIPQQIVTFEQPRLSEPGKHWVPQTFLATTGQDLYSPSTRMERWLNPKLATIHPAGLLTTFPGFTLSLRSHNDGLPRNPWSFLPQIPEWHLLFTGSENRRYDVVAATHILSQGNETDEQRRASTPLLHDMMHQGPCAVILLRESPDNVPQRKWDGLFVNVDEVREGVLYVKSKCHVIVTDMLPSEKVLYDTAERLARQLRSDPTIAEVVRLMPDLTKRERQTGIANKTQQTVVEEDPDKASAMNETSQTSGSHATVVASEEYNVATSAMKARMQEVANDALKDPELVSAIKLLFGDNDEIVGLFWRIVAEWFYHDFEGQPVGENGRWCVD